MLPFYCNSIRAPHFHISHGFCKTIFLFNYYFSVHFSQKIKYTLNTKNLHLGTQHFFRICSFITIIWNRKKTSVLFTDNEQQFLTVHCYHKEGSLQNTQNLDWAVTSIFILNFLSKYSFSLDRYVSIWSDAFYEETKTNFNSSCSKEPAAVSQLQCRPLPLHSSTEQEWISSHCLPLIVSNGVCASVEWDDTGDMDVSPLHSESYATGYNEQLLFTKLPSSTQDTFQV